MATGQEIRNRLEEWGLVHILGTAVGTSATSYLSDTVRLQTLGLASSSFDGAFVRMGGSNALSGVQVRVDYLDQANGRLNVTPAWSEAPTEGDPYEVWAHSIDPDDVDRARDRALTEMCSQWALQPITEIRNGGYEDGVLGSTPTGWSLTTSTFNKTALTFPATASRNSALLTNSSANGYASSTSFYVRPEQSFYFYVRVSARTGTAAVTFRDITNGADITLASGTSTVTGRGWTAVELRAQVPSGCYEIQIRLGAQGDTDVVEYGPVHLTFDEQQRAALPDRIVTEKDVGPVFALRNWMEVENANPRDDDMEEISGIRAIQQLDSVQLRFNIHLRHRPYFFSERIFYSALSTAYQTAAQRKVGTAASTTCNIDYVTAALVRVLAEQYVIKRAEEAEFWATLRGLADRRLVPLEIRYGAKPRARLERTSRKGFRQARI